MTEPEILSQHPLDVLIRRVALGRALSIGELSEVRTHIARAPFGPEPGRAAAHLSKRIAEHQWAPETTVQEYMEDLRYIVSAFSSAMLVYRRRGGILAAFIGLTDLLPREHMGREASAHTIVVCSADRGMVITGYQFGDLSEVSVPGGARWFGRLP